MLKVYFIGKTKQPLIGKTKLTFIVTTKPGKQANKNFKKQSFNGGKRLCSALFARVCCSSLVSVCLAHNNIK
jgi:hypothetical protein